MPPILALLVCVAGETSTAATCETTVLTSLEFTTGNELPLPSLNEPEAMLRITVPAGVPAALAVPFDNRMASSSNGHQALSVL